MRTLKDFIPKQNVDTNNVLDHFEYTNDMPLYTHRKRGGRYVVLATAPYYDAEPAYEGDKMLLCLKPANDGEIDSFIIRSNSPDRETRKNQDTYFMFLGDLQCRLPIQFNVKAKLVVYRNIDKNMNWYRPEEEFLDGRFPRLD